MQSRARKKIHTDQEPGASATALYEDRPRQTRHVPRNRRRRIGRESETPGRVLKLVQYDRIGVLDERDEVFDMKKNVILGLMGAAAFVILCIVLWGSGTDEEPVPAPPAGTTSRATRSSSTQPTPTTTSKRPHHASMRGTTL